VSEKNYTSGTALQHLSQADFPHFSLRRIVPRDSVEKLSGKILIHRLNHARVIGPKPVRRAKKIKPPDRSCAHGTGLFRVLQNYAP